MSTGVALSVAFLIKQGKRSVGCLEALAGSRASISIRNAECLHFFIRFLRESFASIECESFLRLCRVCHLKCLRS